MKRLAMSIAGLAVLSAGWAAVAFARQASPPPVVRYTATQLGGITVVRRDAVARPDRDQTRFRFFSASGARERPVAVLGPDGGEVRLSDQDGADCTLAHVEIVTGRMPAVVSAVRVFSPRLEDNDQSAPAPMSVQVYRPGVSGGVGRPTIVLRASGRPVRTRPLCDVADIRRTMLSHAAGR